MTIVWARGRKGYMLVPVEPEEEEGEEEGEKSSEGKEKSGSDKGGESAEQ